jgi:hypothetical protein
MIADIRTTRFDFLAIAEGWIFAMAVDIHTTPGLL